MKMGITVLCMAVGHQEKHLGALTVLSEAVLNQGAGFGRSVYLGFQHSSATRAYSANLASRARPQSSASLRNPHYKAKQISQGHTPPLTSAVTHKSVS